MFPGRPDQEVRQPEERGERHQDKQVLLHHRLVVHLHQAAERPPGSQDQESQRHLPVPGV